MRVIQHIRGGWENFLHRSCLEVFHGSEADWEEILEHGCNLAKMVHMYLTSVMMLPNLGKVAETLRKSSEIRAQTALMCESSALQWPFGNSMYPCLPYSGVTPFEFERIHSTPSAIAFAAHSNSCMGCLLINQGAD